MESRSLKISIIGLGGLGCPALLALLEAWPIFKNSCKNAFDTLEIKVFDADTVDLSNLNRQILFDPSDVGNAKTHVGLLNLPGRMNKPVPEDIVLVPIQERISSENVDVHLSGNDFIIDCTDSVSIKLLLNDFAVIKKIPLVYSGVQGQKGVVLLVTEGGPCIRCAFGDFTETEERELGDACRTGGIIGASAALAALHQVSLGFSIVHEILSRKEEPGAKAATITTSDLFSINQAKVSKSMLSASLICPLGCSLYPRKILDLRDVKCPDTYLYSKLSLEQLDSSDYLEILFASYEDQQNVEHTICGEGFPIHSSTLNTAVPGHRTITAQRSNNT